MVSSGKSPLLSLALFAVVVLSSFLTDNGVVDAVSADEASASDFCDPGIELPDDFDGSEWPKMWRLDSPDPENPMAANGDVSVDPSVLAKAGITYKFMDPSGYDYPNTTEVPWFPSSNGTNDQELQDIRDEEDYQYADIIANDFFIYYNFSMPQVWEEHFHEASSIRYILEGSAYFDYRDVNNEWVRLQATAGDFLEYPAGIQHRFTFDNSTDGPPFFKIMRLHKVLNPTDPDWAQVYNATPGNNTARDDYVSTYLCDINPDDASYEGYYRNTDTEGNDNTINNIPAPDDATADDSSTSDTTDDSSTTSTTLSDNVDSGATAAGSLLLSLFIVVVGTMSITMF